VATPVLAAIPAVMTALVGVLDLLGAPTGTTGLSRQATFAVDAGTIVTAVAAAGFALKPIRQDLAGFLPIDPQSPVHALALVLATIFFGTQVTFIAFTDVLAANNAQPPLTLLDLFLNEIPFLILALAGVGIFIRRKAPDAGNRLGLVRPAWWHVVLGLAAAGALFALGQQADALNHVWSPDVARRVDATTQHVFGQLGTPLGIALVALLPGICEEVLFRGALQPRIGLLATAFLFTSIHTQYGTSIDTLAVLVIALGLGLIRKYTNTTTSCLCHVSYNLLVGVGIAGGMFTSVAVLLEVVLIAVAAYAIWHQRRRLAAAGGRS
jgi:membrane protease YdiL (CAAX protease family)